MATTFSIFPFPCWPFFARPFFGPLLVHGKSFPPLGPFLVLPTPSGALQPFFPSRVLEGSGCQFTCEFPLFFGGPQLCRRPFHNQSLYSTPPPLTFLDGSHRIFTNLTSARFLARERELPLFQAFFPAGTHREVLISPPPPGACVISHSSHPHGICYFFLQRLFPYQPF